MIEDEWKKMERVIPVAPWTCLDMSCDNEIGDSGASKISESLKVNTTLTELHLEGDE